MILKNKKKIKNQKILSQNTIYKIDLEIAYEFRKSGGSSCISRKNF